MIGSFGHASIAQWKLSGQSGILTCLSSHRRERFLDVVAVGYVTTFDVAVALRIE